MQQLTEAQKRADSLAAQMQKRSSSEQQGAPLVASLFLMAGPPRSEARVPRVVFRGAQIAHIDIQLEAMDKYPRFRASVQTRSGRGDVLVLSDLTPRCTQDRLYRWMCRPACWEQENMSWRLRGFPKAGGLRTSVITTSV